MMKSRCTLPALLLLVGLALGLSTMALATETENQTIRFLPPPGKVTIDGKYDDWDLSGGIFACGDVEHLRDKLSCWFHVMYDQKNIYMLVRWTDDTPLNNPGLVSGDMGFQGDCLQARMVTIPDDPAKFRTSHFTAWRGRDGKDVIDIAWGDRFDEGSIRDAKTEGGQQAFTINADKKGYVQELSVPWKLLAKDANFALKANEKVIITLEPNFGTDSKFRISVKDILRAGIVPDRVFTFGSKSVWGFGTASAKGHVLPQALRLADNRELTVKMDADGVPVVDWSRVYAEKTLEGFAKITFTMPEDGFVSLNIKNADGQLVRQLLTANFYAKGAHTILWDGLTNMSHLKPGEVVPGGTYTWDAIWHKGIGARLVGWACNSGKAPFDSPGGNWGGDMGSPMAVATDGQRMYLGWEASEAGKALVTTDLDGNLIWRHKRGGFGGARMLAADNGIVYVYDNDNYIYRLDAQKGDYSAWKGSEEAILHITPLLKPHAAADVDRPMGTGIDAAGGKLYIAYEPGNIVVVVDGATGALLKTLPVEAPSDLEIGADKQLYVISASKSIVRIDPETGTATSLVNGMANAIGLALDADGAIYVGGPDSQVKVFDRDGKPVRTVGKPGGRPLYGAWDKDGMLNIAGMRVDAQGKLWVTERDESPRRISVWNAKTGAFMKEFFGPTNYGAGGGAISPLDPYTMVGHGAEWKLNKETGRAECVNNFYRGGMANSRFGIGANNRLYLAVCADNWRPTPVKILERLTDGTWKLRTILSPIKDGVRVWADGNDDQQEQANEIHDYPINLGGTWINGWYMPMTQSLTFYGQTYRIGVTGYTACGAPLYDLTQAKLLPGPDDKHTRGGMSAQRGVGSEDGKLMLYNGLYGEAHSDFPCYDIETGKLKWSYPNNYVGVHGGHSAPPPQTGMIRGAYDIVGTAKLPAPIGDVFVIATDKGEWHMLNGEGFYLTKFFEADPFKIQWPDPAVPGVVMDTTPPGMGAEDFGGSIIATKEGQLYLQAGKTAFINNKVVGLETVKKLGTGTLTVSAKNLDQARLLREKLVQKAAPNKIANLKKSTVAFTGDLRKDFSLQQPMIEIAKSNTKVEAAIAYDATNMYLGWQVDDNTPWVNGATEPPVMYACGDTVDFQIGTNAKVDIMRTEAALGDLRLSIGNFQGKPTAVVYRRIATDKHPRKFYSGVVREGYEMQSVVVLGPEAQIAVKVDAMTKRYVVEAAIPLKSFGITLTPGLTLSGDMGVTYGDPDGKDTVLRSYWNNQATGIVADEVYELQLQPANWGKLLFEE